MISAISRAEVVGHPGHRGELHPVGLLVQAHPEPEVVRVGLELALDVDDVRRDQQQPARARRGASWNGSNWPSTLEPRKPSMAPSSTPVIREPIASASGDGAPFFSCSLSISGAITVGEAVGVGLDPAGPVDDQHGRGALLGDEPGELADERRGPLGAGAQLLDGRRSASARLTRGPSPDEPGPRP